MSALPVEIVRPKKSTGETTVEFFGHLLNLVVRAWVVMLVLPILGQQWSYWKAMAAVLAVTYLLPANGYLSWPRTADQTLRKLGGAK